jgi:putative membrane protein
MNQKKKKNTTYQKDKTPWSEAPFLMIKGFLMGSADIVPGVSGGTMALITGIYDRLISAIRSFDTKSISYALRFKAAKLFEYIHWKFLLLLLSGIFMAVLFFTRIVPLQIYMFTHPELIYGLFFGLIVGSIVLLIFEIEPQERTKKIVLPLIAGALIGFWIVTLVPTDTSESFFFVFLSGVIAITAMILPGISGSYLLLILRKYDYILSQLGALGGSETIDAFLNLLPFGLGAVAGLMIFSRILSWLLKNYHTVTIAVLIGFLIGSLYVIWPFQEREYQTIIKETEQADVTSDLVQELSERKQEPNLPEYQRLKTGTELPIEGEVTVETIERKMIKSEPFVPGISDQDTQEVNLYEGVGGMGMGVILIFVITYLRKHE